MTKEQIRELEEHYCEVALEYKKAYKECRWWQFKKKKYNYDMWQSGLDMMMRVNMLTKSR